MTTTQRRPWLIVSVCLLGVAMLLGPAAFADNTSDEADEDNRRSQTDAPPSLDDLLGLEEDTDASGERTAEQIAEEDLQRELTGERFANEFEQALASMMRSAELLDTSFDPGMGTQRIQEDVLAKLQQLIDQARQQEDSSSSSSSSQQQQQQQSDPGQQQQQQQEQGQQQQSNGDADGEEAEGPPMQEGDIGTTIEETRQEWGSLPQRVRDMLLQGREERFSSLYEQMTREYYRRLAEE